MGRKITIRVHYPLSSGRMALRTDGDWDRDIKPVSVSRDGTRFDFCLEPDKPYVYFKPVIRENGTIHWAQGDNYLAFPSGRGARNVHPYFFADPVCSACVLQRVPSAGAMKEHAVRVFYPPGYHENTLARYPVLYMHDGQNLFFPGEAFNGQHWKVQETLRILDSMSLVKKAIVVGIYPGDRKADYTSPGYEAYGRFIVEELKPWVDSTYRTLKGPAHTAVMGSSLGGVVSLFLGWQWPEVFGKVACMSSTFGWKDDLFDRVESEQRRAISIYLDSGWPRDNYEVTRSMRALLQRRGFQDGRDLLYFAFPEARHDERHWAVRAHVPFQFFFGRQAA